MGKTTLASLLKGVGKQPLILDLDEGSKDLDVDRVSGITTLPDLLGAVKDAELWTDHDVLVIDSLTKAEDLVVDALKREDGAPSLERVAGGYGKGYRLLYERMLTLTKSPVKATEGVPGVS